MLTWHDIQGFLHDMKYAAATLVVLLSVGAQLHAQGLSGEADILFQVSTLAALTAGDYAGRVDYRTVKRHGDFGLGTFDALDGEMVAVDGAFYQIRADGIATPVGDDERTPFAAVTDFRADDVFHVNGETPCSELRRLLRERFPSDRLLYAIKVSGHFKALQTRSVPAQDKPYKPLAEVLQHQVVFNFAQVDAVLAGFWLPADVAAVNAPGFHFHAIMRDSMSGGHFLDCVAQAVTVEIDYLNALQVQFGGGERPHPLVPKPGRGASPPRG
jgi:acetolactate decarboxylase